jgi:hypothetical protein
VNKIEQPSHFTAGNGLFISFVFSASQRPRARERRRIVKGLFAYFIFFYSEREFLQHRSLSAYQVYSSECSQPLGDQQVRVSRLANISFGKCGLAPPAKHTPTWQRTIYFSARVQRAAFVVVTYGNSAAKSLELKELRIFKVISSKHISHVNVFRAMFFNVFYILIGAYGHRKMVNF